MWLMPVSSDNGLELFGHAASLGVIQSILMGRSRPVTRYFAGLSLIASRFFGSFALTVSVPPCGPLIVTVWAFLSTAVMVAVTVTSRPMAPAGVSPGFELTRVSCVLTPGAAVPAFRT